jgi:hypothetical protein
VNEIVKSLAVITVLAMLGGLAITITNRAVRTHKPDTVAETVPASAHRSGADSLPHTDTIRDSVSVKESR